MSTNFTPYSKPSGFNIASQDQEVNTYDAPYAPAGIYDYPTVRKYLLWDENSGTGVFRSFIADLMSTDLTNISAYSSPIDAVLYCGFVPFKPQMVSVNAEIIKIGNIFLSIDSMAPTYTDGSGYHLCGQYGYDKKGYYDSFLDYSPYTKATIYLPFIGWRDVDASIFYDEGRRDSNGNLMWDYLDVYYNINYITGALVATIYGRRDDHEHSDVTVSNIPLYQFSGNGMETIPLTQDQASTKAQSLMTCIASGVGGAFGTVAGIASGNPLMALGSFGAGLAGIGKGVQQGLDRNADLSVKGTITGETAYLLPRKILVLLKTPKQMMPQYLSQTEGITSNVGKTMAELTGQGFNALSTFHLDGFSCLDDEKEELAALFRAGCIF